MRVVAAQPVYNSFRSFSDVTRQVCSLEPSQFNLGPFSALTKRGKTWKARLKAFSALVRLFSGGDAAALFHTFLEHTEDGKKLREGLFAASTEKAVAPYRACLSDIAKYHSQLPELQRRPVMSCVTPHFSRAQAKELGFSFSKGHWKTSRKHERDEGPGAPLPPKRVQRTGPHAPLPPELEPEVAAHVATSVNPSAHREITKGSRKRKNPVPGDRETVPVQNVEKPFSTLHREFNDKTKIRRISRKAFMKLVPAEFKKPHQQTDKCEYCVGKKHNDAKLLSLHNILTCCVLAEGASDSPTDQIQALKACENHSEEEKANVMNLLETRKLLLTHGSLKVSIKASIEEIEKNLGPGECIMFMDWNENVQLSHGPVQVGRNWYTLPQRSVFGVCVTYKDATGAPQNKYFALISEVLDKSANVAKQAIQLVLSQHDFNFKHAHFVTDCAGTFRSGEFIHIVIEDIPAKFQIETDLHFLPNKHSKERVDAMFARISGWLKSLKARHDVTNSESLINGLRLMILEAAKNQN